MFNFSNILKSSPYIGEATLHNIGKVEYYLKRCFNHAHCPRGTKINDVPVGGEFTSTYYPKLDAKGVPIKDHNGKYTHQVDSHGDKIPKPPGHVIISEAADSSHDRSSRTDLNVTTGTKLANALGSSRDPKYAERMRVLIDYVHNLTDHDNGKSTQTLASQDQQSNLKKGTKRAPKKKGEVYIQSVEHSKPRSKDLDVSTKDCPSEAEAMACLIGQYSHRSTKNFASNQATDLDGKAFGVSHDQPNKLITAEFDKSKFKTTKELQKALDEHFKNSDIKPTVGKSEDGKGFSVSYQLGNGAATGNAKDQAEQSRVADFNLKNQSSLREHPKHWNGVEEKINTREQVTRLNQFAKKHPEHPLSAEWLAAKPPKAPRPPKVPKAPKGTRSNPHGSVTNTTQT